MALTGTSQAMCQLPDTEHSSVPHNGRPSRQTPAQSNGNSWISMKSAEKPAIE